MSYKAKLIKANAEHSLTVILSQHFDGISFRYVSIMFCFWLLGNYVCHKQSPLQIDFLQK